MGCCLMGCLRLLFFQLWKVLLAALLAVVFARIDAYVEGRHPESSAGRAWRAYRGRRKKTRPTRTRPSAANGPQRPSA